MKNIIISNKEELNFKIKEIKKQGNENLHVITDFDKTLTKGFVKGQKSPTVIAQLREGKYLTPDYAPRAYALFEKYHPIEIDSNINSKEKNKKMNEWWKAHFDLLVKCGMNKKTIEEVVKNRKIAFRAGVLEFLDGLHKNNIPLIIMSASVGDIIKEYLKYENKLYSNIHIVANLFKFDSNGKVIGVEEPIIHSLNKNEITLDKLEVYKKLLKRKNVLLLGDSLDDVGMVDGFHYKNLIKIGFLNENIEANIKDYKKSYDVVILNDGNMNYINGLVKKIISKNE
jgi:cytosolic 5'-nucleotidase 3